MAGIGEHPSDFSGSPDAEKIVFRSEAVDAQNSREAGTSAGLRSHAEGSVLLALGFSKPMVERCLRLAAKNGARAEDELLASGFVEENAYFEALARLVGLPFVGSIDATLIVDTPQLDTQLANPTTVRLSLAASAPLTVIAPRVGQCEKLMTMLKERPHLRQQFAIASRTTIRTAVWQAGSKRRAEGAVRLLFEGRSDYSARFVITGAQGLLLGALASALVSALIAMPGRTLLFLHTVVSFVYFFSLALRCLALLWRVTARRPKPLPNEDGPLPVYTVLVALYGEARVAGQLMASLKRLNWPKSRLDIKIVCEEGDDETIEAIRRAQPGPEVEIVVVPKVGPQTKPKALDYALAGARGTYTAIFDAEDRPHPDQLREAYYHFQSVGPDVACLQAPLIITNAHRGWLPSLFAMEYGAFFRAILPLLSMMRMPMPLGGTSNHFRTDVLKSCGAWDPYNVTEDADLGMRLYRLGYRAEVIKRHTLEDAPTRIGVWRKQRTRWFKGWMQTWLVLMRKPGALIRDFGPKAFIVFQLMIGGMLISALAHPLIFLFLAAPLMPYIGVTPPESHFVHTALFALDSISIFGNYGLFLALGSVSLIQYEKRRLGRRWLAFPLYWMLISYAAWMAVLELWRKPHFWNKTPHGEDQSAHASTNKNKHKDARHN
ncbi:glycosyltransferase family 2 protein [Rhizobium sp. PAMB 3182]